MQPVRFPAKSFGQKARGFLTPDWRTMIIFIPISLLAAGFFASPQAFTFLLLPFGGLYYFFLSYVVGALGLLLGPDFIWSGDGFLSTLAVTGVGYLYVLSCYISYISKRRHDAKRVLMIISLAGIFASPFGVLYVPQFLYPPSYYEAQAAALITYLDEKACRDMPVEEGTGFSTWDAAGARCTVTGTGELPPDYLLLIREGFTLEVSGESSELRYAGFQTLVNNGTIALIEGATFINAKDSSDPQNPREALLLNHGVIAVDKKSTFVNQAGIDNAELEGTIINHGTFESRGLIYSNNMIENRGLFTNSGYLWSYNTDLLVSQDKKVAIVNHGVMRNYYAMDNSGGEFYNHGTVENLGRLSIGTLHNYATIENYAAILTGETAYNYCGAAPIPDRVEIQTIEMCKVTVAQGQGSE
jgi:hypothetical protein